MKSYHFKFFFISAVFIYACKEKPTYNPFDDQYNIAVSALVNDQCDTISAGCGYFNLIQKSGHLKTYYQYFMEDPNEIVAKGFHYVIDSFEVEINNGRVYTNHELMDSIIHLPMNKNRLNTALNPFDYKIFRRDKEKVHIVNELKKDTIILYIRTGDDGIHNDVLYRVINYYDSPEYGKANKN